MITTTTIDLFSFDDASLCSITRLSQLSGLSPNELVLLVEHGLLLPAEGGARDIDSRGDPAGAPASTMEPAASEQIGLLSFHMRNAVVAHAARRLRDDFELEGDGWLLAVRLWKRLQETEAELASVRAQLSRFLGQ